MWQPALVKGTNPFPPSPTSSRRHEAAARPAALPWLGRDDGGRAAARPALQLLSPRPRSERRALALPPPRCLSVGLFSPALYVFEMGQVPFRPWEPASDSDHVQYNWGYRRIVLPSCWNLGFLWSIHPFQWVTFSKTWGNQQHMFCSGNYWLKDTG